MAKVKDIFITSQGGLNPCYNAWVKEATEEFMAMFPEHEGEYPVTDIGNWRSRDYTIGHSEYMRVPPKHRSLYIPTTDNRFLKPFESTDWAMCMAKLSAINCNREHQLDASKLLDLMDYDPTVRDIPQIAVHLTKDDIFAMTDHGPTNFVYGLGSFNKGLVLSTYRYEKAYGDNPAYLKEVIKTITMHELGHIFAATREGRHNSADRDGYGQHCDCPGCIMRTDTKAKSNELTNDRLERKAKNQPPMCPECVAMVNCMMAQLNGNTLQLSRAAEKFNMITAQTRTYS